MANYINLETKQVSTEHEIRSAHPNTSFPSPFTIEGYAVVFDAPQPTYDKYTQTVAQSVPVETIKGHWEQTWIVLDLNDEQLVLAQAQKSEDEKAKIKAEIAKLEDSVTPRRQREAILAIDTTWLADVELQIGQLRQQLAEYDNA
jgi:hypothetical protein